MKISGLVAVIALGSLSVACTPPPPPFHLDQSLRAITPIELRGGGTALPACATRPESKEAHSDPAMRPREPPEPPQPFKVGRRLTFGDAEVVVESVDQQTVNRHLFADATLRALRSARAAAGQVKEVAQYGVAINLVQSEAAQVDIRLKVKEGARVAELSGQVMSVLSDVLSLGEIVTDAREQMSFSMTLRRGSRTVGVSCDSLDVFHPLEIFPEPNFSLTCALVPSVEPPGPRWSLEVKASGNWQFSSYAGTLRRQDTPQTLAFANQVYKLWGFGMATGFDLRVDNQQHAAVTLAGTLAGYPDVQRPLLWLTPHDEVEQDIEAATLALAYLYPWPVHCPPAENQ